MKSTVVTAIGILSCTSAQVTEWGRTRSERTRRHRSLGVAHSPELFEDMSLSMPMSMRDSSMSMVDYYPPVEEENNGWGGDGNAVIGMDADGNPISLKSSAAVLAVSGATLFVGGFMAMF